MGIDALIVHLQIAERKTCNGRKMNGKNVVITNLKVCFVSQILTLWRKILIHMIDEMALNCEMGLYKQFNVTADGIPYGCHGLEEFKSEHWLDVNNLGNRFRKTFSWSVESSVDNPYPLDNGPALDVWQKIEPECPLNKMRVGGSRPLSNSFNLFARNQNRWIQAFIPTFEKMMANGYKSGDLVDGPNDGITCNRQDPKSNRPVCKKN